MLSMFRMMICHRMKEILHMKEISLSVLLIIGLLLVHLLVMEQVMIILLLLEVRNVTSFSLFFFCF